jgi:hypothetical protein
MRHFVLLSVLFAGCSVGEVPLNGTGPDGSTGGDGAQGVCAMRVTPGNPHIHTAGGTSNAGLGCVVDGCHGPPNPGGPLYLAAGTIYTTTAGIAGAAGAEIRVGALKTKTDSAGNFAIISGTNPFPTNAIASGCPTADAHMTGVLTTTLQGNCNGGTACHQMPGGIAMVLANQ